MRIGQAAARAGVTCDTLRYYERQGLVPRPPRATNGYREYPDAIVGRVRFVRNALRFGFSVKQVAGFLRERDAGRPPCRNVRKTAEQLLDNVDRQIERLTASRESMRRTLAEWDARLASTPKGVPARLLEHIEWPA
jgi:MerR family copper efflux transcriptional regulator